MEHLLLNGVKTRDSGHQDPTFIFVHGFGCSLDDYSAQFDGLSSTFRCIALDLPGHGGSAMPPEPTIAALAHAVNHVKAQSGSRAVILSGHSMGSKVVREAYRQQNDGVAGLVFIDGSTSIGDVEVLIRRMRDEIHSAGYRAFADRLFNGMLFGDSDRKLLPSLIARAQRLDPELAEALLVDSIRWELLGGAAALEKIAVPTLALQSTYFDSDFKRRPLQPGIGTPFMKMLPKAVAKAEVQTILGAGHLPMIEAPEVVNQKLLDFANRIHRTNPSGE